MKTRSLISLVGLAMSFAFPILAQQKATLDSQAVEKTDPLAGQYDKTCNSNEAAAEAALFTDDAVFITPDGPIVGREAIEKQYTEWFKGGHTSNHKTTYNPASFPIAGTADTIALSGGWSETVEPVNGKPFQLKGRWIAIDTRGSDGWKIWKLAYNQAQEPAPTANPTSK
jgi:ketosteroid isomerase-like protein